MISGKTWTTTGVVALSTIGAAALCLAIYTALLFHDLPDTADLASYRPPTATRVFAWDGTLIGEYSDERRVYVPYEKIPPHLAQAFMAAEDRNFFHHHGIDAGGFTRAMIKNVSNVVRGRRLESGSTITQQVAKNILNNSDPTIGRKIKEAYIASQLELQLTKEHILELYLNEIWLGYRSYGVGVAAYNYFGKSLDQLTLAECAYLAALPKGPDNYHPLRHKAAAMARRNWILDQMVETGAVTRAEANEAKAQDLVVQPGPTRARYSYASFFVEEVRRNMLGDRRFGEKINKGGYYIRTSLDARLQEEARDALMNGLERYDRRHGWRGAWGNVPIAEGWRAEALKRNPPSERTAWRAAIVESVSGAAVRVQPAAEGMAGGLLAGEDVSWAQAGRGLKAGDLVFVEPAATGGYRLRQVPQVNGAMVAIDPHSGRTLAMVGGYSFSLSNFNRATQAERQPGSSFKPFVYATALENDFTPASVILDGPISLVGGDGKPWNPGNYEQGRYYGPLVLRRGLELSLNTMTVRLAQQVGMRKVAAKAEEMGVVDHMEPVLAMALGAGETTPLRLAGAYSAFVNGGRRIDPHLVEVVQDREGKTLYRADDRNCPRCTAGFNGSEAPRLQPLGKQVIDPVTAYQITSMLQGVVQRGTAASASSLGVPMGGKTGTTNDYRSAWFVGFTPDMIVCVFVGFDDNRSLGSGETGSQAALPIFIEFMKEALKDQPVHDFVAPREARFAMVNGIREAFRVGAEPRSDEILSTDALDNRSSNPGIAMPSAPVAPVVVRPVTPESPPPPPPPPAPKAAPPPPPPSKVPDNLQGLY